MASRFASRWFVPAVFALSAVIPVAAAQAAGAAQLQPAHWGPGDGYGYGYGGHHHRHHHYHPNCNNDPESPYAMGPECPRSHNSDYSGYGYGWPYD
jgi:hypothetical protein